MININQQHHIQLSGRQVSFRLSSQDRLNVLNALRGRITPQSLQHRLLQVVGIDNSIGRHQFCHSYAVKPSARADIAYKHPWLQIQRRDGLIRMFLRFALAAVQPVRSAHPHHRRNLAARNWMNVLGERDCGNNGNTNRKCYGNSRSLQVLAALLALILFLPIAMPAADSTLAIVRGGVQDSEDAPFVSSTYYFLPGDYLYFTFDIAGFAIATSEHGRKISLTYEIVPLDARDVPLTPPVTGEVDAELNPEDKTWTPRRRASFLLPSFVAAGPCHLHVTIKDLVAKTEISADYPFHMGGVKIEPSTSITAESFGFYRSENDREPLSLPAYAPGDTVFATFDMTGYKIDAKNGYHVAYGLTVLTPDGKKFVDQPKAAELQDSSFYPAQFVPGSIQILTTAKAGRGEYIVVLTVRDLLAGSSYELRKAFTIE
jgi:hypothetical protein